MGKKYKKEEKKSKKEKKPTKSRQSKKEKSKVNAARKRLHYMAINYDSEKTNVPFSEYLEKKREKEEKINQLVIEAKLDSDSIASLTNFLEDNDFSEKDFSDEDEEFSLSDKGGKKSSEKTQKFDINKPLQGKIIVLSGDMIIPREYLKVILLNLGAKVTTAISNKTDILIHGETLEDGRRINLGRKYKMAKAKKVKIYLDRDFEKYMGELINKEWKMKDEAKKVKI